MTKEVVFGLGGKDLLFSLEDREDPPPRDTKLEECSRSSSFLFFFNELRGFYLKA